MIAKFAVKHPTMIVVFFALLVGLSIYAGLDLAVDLYPEVSPPVLIVSTSYNGAGPEEVEENITKILEGSLSSVSDIDELSSSSSEGSSLITIEFNYGTDLAEAANDIRDKIDLIRDYLPESADSPIIFKFDPSSMPIMALLVTGNRPPEDLRQIAEDTIEPLLSQVSGVSQVSVSGGREKIIRVDVSQNRLEANNITLTSISKTLASQNIQVSAGSITEGTNNYILSTRGKYSSIEEIKNTVISTKTASDGSSKTYVRLKDIANVYEGLEDEESSVYVNGEPGVYVKIQKQSGRNSVQTADNVLSRLDNIKNQLPKGVTIEVKRDSTTSIRNSLSNVLSSVFSGALLAVIVLFIFLRSIKSNIIIVLAIPISVLITLMTMYFFGLTLNLMTLAGLTLGIGMLVDNSIVILENIYRYREKGTKPETASIVGTQEMIMAITASTLTTICVFLPMVMFKSQLGMFGELFSALAFTVVISLASSLLVAIFLVPVLTSKYLVISTRIEVPLKGKLKKADDFMENIWNNIRLSYEKGLKWVLLHKKVTITFITLIFIGSFFLIPVTGIELMPSEEDDTVSISVKLPSGTKLDETKNFMSQLEDIVKTEIKGYKDIITTAGEKGFFGMLGSSESNKGSMSITLPEYSKRIDSSSVVKEKLRSHFNDFPSAEFSFSNQHSIGSSNPIDITVKSEDLALAKSVATKICNIIKDNVKEAREPAVDMKDGLPQIDVVIDRDKIYTLGLDISTIGTELQANIAGIVSSTYKSGGEEYDIRVSLADDDKDALPDLNKIYVKNSEGKKIPFSTFADFEKTSGPVTISRENQSRVIHVEAGLKPGAKLNEVEKAIKKAVKENLPQEDGVVIEYSGDYSDMMAYSIKILIILLIAVALVFGVMASQFESFIDPFIIFFTIPLTLIGVILINVITGTKLSLFSGVGIIVLVGVVVNNGIVLVDYTNLLRKRGKSTFEALIEAGGNRLRPILMSTLTTILGLLPMAFFPGEGSDLVQPIGKTIFGGLTVSTIFTLFLIPTIYLIMNNLSDKFAVRSNNKKAERMKARKIALANHAFDIQNVNKNGGIL